MEKRNESTKKSNNSSMSFATSNKTIGPISFPLPSLPTTSAPIVPRGQSPFQVWYSFQPEFIPPLNFATQIPTVEIRLKILEQVRREVSAALQVASEVMKRKGPSAASQKFVVDQQVWLEGTNVKTTHPKAKLAPRCHGPFKILSTTPTNSRLKLPLSW
jgi:hypothetical protein